MPTKTSRRSAVFALCALPALQSLQAQGNRKSPHETVTKETGGKKVEIAYGRPSLKGRKAFAGGELAPNGTVWRLGADEATKMTLSADATVGSVKVPAGSYALFAIPGDSEWTMIVDKKADQWGAFSYDKSQDLGRFTVPVKKVSSPVETFTIKLDEAGSGNLMANLSWQDASVSFPIKFS